MESKEITLQRLINSIVSNKGKFTKECFNILCTNCFTPKSIFEVLHSLIINILNSSEVDKTLAIESIHHAIKHSSHLLDSFITALYDWNNSEFTAITSFHNFLNNELVKKDWSHLSSPNIIHLPSVSQKEPLKKLIHPIDVCIYEILFSCTPPEKLACSQFIYVNIDSTFDLLSDKALNNFTDALLIRFSKEPSEIFQRISKKSGILDKENSFVFSMFRERNDYSIFQQVFSFNQELISTHLQNIQFIFDTFIKTTKRNLFPFFAYIIIPYADYFSDQFIQSVINCSTFPSNDSNFPKELFLQSQKCSSFITFKILFDIFKEGELDLFVQYFENANQNISFNNLSPNSKDLENYRIETVLQNIFSSSEESLQFFKDIFIWYIQNYPSLNPEIICKSISTFLPQYSDNICYFCIEALKNNAKPELFLHLNTFLSFFDYAYINPQPTLNFILSASLLYYDNENVRSFWIENTSIIIDSIMNNHSFTTEFSQFLLSFMRNGPQNAIKDIFGSFADDFDFSRSDSHNNDLALQVFSQFTNIC
ncbi:hypothetical protein TRFO_07787 [Tritrichomonas foetus]|uniref:Uncharacterized protein n=1 Tax=Tritrichomonas foetus TaxID=1144522 RepID=A0A1J4JNU4_9EUKA|nr:hypothetical protein TRFO_07787 [Tritrichomonas foetus]|eukprot:OHT00801.1 hypothetical protein TRFO_07787 [Tritrichomonas foetus]